MKSKLDRKIVITLNMTTEETAWLNNLMKVMKMIKTADLLETSFEDRVQSAIKKSNCIELTEQDARMLKCYVQNPLCNFNEESEENMVMRNIFWTELSSIMPAY